MAVDHNCVLRGPRGSRPRAFLANLVAAVAIAAAIAPLAAACAVPADTAVTASQSLSEFGAPSLECAAALDCGPGQYCSEGRCTPMPASQCAPERPASDPEQRPTEPSDADKREYFDWLVAALDRVLASSEGNLVARETAIAALGNADLVALREDTVIAACAARIAGLRSDIRAGRDIVVATDLAAQADRLECVDYLRRHGLMSATVPWEAGVEARFASEFAAYLTPLLGGTFYTETERNIAAQMIRDHLERNAHYGIRVVDTAAGATSVDGMVTIAMDTDVVAVLAQDPACRERSRLAELRFLASYRTQQLRDLTTATYHANTLLSAPATPAAGPSLTYRNVATTLTTNPGLEPEAFRVVIAAALGNLRANVAVLRERRMAGGALAAYSEENLLYLAQGAALRAHLQVPAGRDAVADRVERWIDSRLRRGALGDALVSLGTGVAGLVLALLPPSWPLVVAGTVLVGATGYRAYSGYREALEAQRAWLTSAGAPVFYDRGGAEAANARFFARLLDLVNAGSGLVSQGFRLALRAGSAPVGAVHGAGTPAADLDAMVLRVAMREHMSGGVDAGMVASLRGAGIGTTYDDLARWLAQEPGAFTVFSSADDVPWARIVAHLDANPADELFFSVVQLPDSEALHFFAINQAAIRRVFNAFPPNTATHTFLELAPGLRTAIYDFVPGVRYGQLSGHAAGRVFSIARMPVQAASPGAAEITFTAPRGVPQGLAFPESFNLRYQIGDDFEWLVGLTP